jgi:hypothetical protein
MRTKRWILNLMLVAGALAAPMALTGCATGYAYDRPYHSWDQSEVGFYLQWEGATHRDHVDYDKRSSDEQRAYRDWRHGHAT